MKNWDRAVAGASVHAIVEPGGDVYQLLPWGSRSLVTVFPLFSIKICKSWYSAWLTVISSSPQNTAVLFLSIEIDMVFQCFLPTFQCSKYKNGILFLA